MDSPNNEQQARPVVSLLLTYPKGATLEQRVQRLENFAVAVIVVAIVLAIFLGLMIWAFLTKYGVI